MKKFIRILLLLLVMFGFCSCSGTYNAISSKSDLSTNSSVIENFSSKNNSTSYNSSSKPQSSSSVNVDSSINLHLLPVPSAKKVPDTLSKNDIHDIIVDNFEVELSKKIKITSGQIIYEYDSYYFSWEETNSYYPYLDIRWVMISLNLNDFNNLLKQLKKDWKVGRIERSHHIPYEYEYKKIYTFEKKYKDTVIAEYEKAKTIYINKINDNEYIAEFNGTFYNPEFKSGTFDIQEDGTGEKRDMSNNEWERFN